MPQDSTVDDGPVTHAGEAAPAELDEPIAGPLPGPRHTLVVLAAFCAALAGTEPVILVAAGWDGVPLALWVSIVVLYFASGLIAIWRQPHNPFGSLLLLAGIAHWCAGMLTVPVLGLAVIGSLTRSLPLAILIHIILAFPTGRLPGRQARVAVVLAYVTSTVLELPSVLLDAAGPVRLADHGPAAAILDVLGALQRPAGLACLLLAMTALWSRWMTRRRYRDNRLGPFVLYGFACLLGMTLTIVARLLGAASVGDPAVLQRIAELQGYLIALLPVVFLVGVLTGSYGRTGELREFFAGVGGRDPAADFDAAVGRAVELPDSRVVYRSEETGDFVGADGSPVAAISGEHYYPIRYGPQVVGAIVYRPDSGVDLKLLAAVAEASALVVSHRRTLASRQAALLELRRTDRALRQSRRRIAQAADRERRRIARDLHDGLQQHALALGMRAQELRWVQGDPDAIADTADALRDGIVTLLAELRGLIQGIMPPPLVERGVVSAVRALSGRLPVPVDVQVVGEPRRLPAEIESTVYFVVLEVVTNSVKHSRGTAIIVRLELAADRVVAEVTDDGIGGATVGAGSGLIGVRDRLAAFGGTLEVTSEPGAGSRVRMMVPCG